MWSSGALMAESPEQLLHTVWHSNTKYLGLRDNH